MTTRPGTGRKFQKERRQRRRKRNYRLALHFLLSLSRGRGQIQKFSNFFLEEKRTRENKKQKNPSTKNWHHRRPQKKRGFYGSIVQRTNAMTTTTTTTSRAAGAPDRRTCFSPASGSGPRGDLRLSLLKKRVEGVQKFLKSSVPEFITNNCATKYEGDNEKKTSENTTTTTKRREKRLRKPMRSILTASISEQNSINKNKNNKMNSETTALV